MAQEKSQLLYKSGRFSSGKAPVCAHWWHSALLEASFMDMRMRMIQGHNSGSQPLFSAKYSWYTHD